MTETALNIDPTHIAWRCGTEDQTRRVLNDLERAVAAAKARRVKILADISKANDAAFAGDRRQLFVLGSLNKQEAETGRLILSIERQITEARKRLATLEAHAANSAAAARAVVAPGDATKWRWFEITTPDGRVLRHRAVSFAELEGSLLKGYRVSAEVFGASATGTGGVAAGIGSDVPSIMAGLLAAHGDEIVAYLAARGIGSDKSVIVLPGNGRDEEPRPS
jgi:hypothetical protein